MDYLQKQAADMGPEVGRFGVVAPKVGIGDGIARAEEHVDEGLYRSAEECSGGVDADVDACLQERGRSEAS
jgi:hypothetical protein